MRSVEPRYMLEHPEAFVATTQSERVIVTAEKYEGLGNQQGTQ